MAKVKALTGLLGIIYVLSVIPALVIDFHAAAVLERFKQFFI